MRRRRPTRRRPTRRNRRSRRPTHRRPTRRRPTQPPPTQPPTTAAPTDDRRRRRLAGDDHDLTPSPLWGKQTELAIGNFPIAHRPLDVRVAHALATIKRHAAVVNLRLGVAGLDADVGRRDRRRGPAHRGRRARRLVPGRRLPDRVGHVDEHERQRGDRHAGVAALGRPVHPNDHVNASQSSNDVVPAAIRLAVIAELAGHTHPALDTLVDALRDLSRAHDGRRQGRPHPPDGRHAGDGRPGGRRLGRPARAGARPFASPTSAPSASCRSAAPPWAPGSTRPTASPPRSSRRSPPRPGSRCARPPTRWSTRVARAPSPRRRAGCAPSPWR